MAGSGLLCVLHLAENADLLADENTTAFESCIPV